MRGVVGRATIAAVALMGLAAPVAFGATDHLVTVGSPQGPSTFSENKQNEPGLAINAANPSQTVAGSNDNIDETFCDANDCSFVPGIGVSGIYFSFSQNDLSWSQPTYRGLTGRGLIGQNTKMGPIGTLPNYIGAGLQSDGDPTLAFGPRPDRKGNFSWSNGSRLYYGNLTANASADPKHAAFVGEEAIAVSHTDNLQAAAAGQESAWSRPVLASAALQKQAQVFSDKDTIWADNAASSPYFGNVYVCWTDFENDAGTIQPIVVARSRDGGNTFDKPVALSAAPIAPNSVGRQGCIVRTDSHGNVFVFWEDSNKQGSFQAMARSFNGGKTFDKARQVSPVTDVGLPDPASGDAVFDGFAGARTDSFPSVDIANGAPSGKNAPNTIAIAWSDGPTTSGGSTERALVRYSTNGGNSWSSAQSIGQSGDRPDFPWIALSPNGQHVYVAYDAFTTPFQTTTASPRPMQGVVRGGTVGGSFTTLHRGAVGDARGSSANALDGEFIGDYNWVVATNNYAVAVWNDVRNAQDCPAVDAWRQALIDTNGTSTEPPPAPNTACANRFGNQDIFSVKVTP
jgi:hypothetical protein